MFGVHPQRQWSAGAIAAFHDMLISFVDDGMLRFLIICINSKKECEIKKELLNARYWSKIFLVEVCHPK